VNKTSLQDRFAGQMGQLLGPEFPPDIALAVSGGGDSMAMLALSHEWARVMGTRLWVVTVDHGLRSESATEAAMVAAECAALGHPHTTLRWHWDGQGNLLDAARRARLSLIDRWRAGIDHVLMAHTADDVAETFLMRLARGSGVSGLAAMAAKRVVQPHRGPPPPLPLSDVTATQAPPLPDRRAADVLACGMGFTLVRPLLTETRDDLRHYIRTLKVPFIDDPSNDDPSFERVRIRKALETLGIDRTVLTATAMRMARAREALVARAADVASRIVSEARAGTSPLGDLLIDRDGFAKVERETQLHLLAAALQWVASAEYRPRSAPLEALLDRALAGGGGTLHGAQVAVGRGHLRIFREYAALGSLGSDASVPGIWDGRWRLCGNGKKGWIVRALGPDGWAQIPDKPADASPFIAARSLPAVFDGDRLVACPALGFGAPLPVDFCPRGGPFAALGDSH